MTGRSRTWPDGMVCAPRSNQDPDDCADHDHEPLVAAVDPVAAAKWLAENDPDATPDDASRQTGGAS